MKLAKYAFKDQATFESKLKALGVETDEDGNEYPTHSHAIVKLGHIVLEQGQYDEEGNEIEQSHPYGWASYAVTISDGNGVHSFYGVDYQSNKL